jgi:replicative DNA helicase
MSIDWSNHWKSQKDAYQKALTYVHARQQGLITSFMTPWQKVNEAGVNGIEWQSLVVIGGRPGTGKTLIKDQIVREAGKNNPGKNQRILEFQFEMVARASKVREFCSVLGKPYKYICSANMNDKLTDADFKKLHAHSQESVDVDKYPVDIVENPCTVEDFIQIVSCYMEKHAQMVDGKDEDGNPIKVKVYTNTVVTADHSYLFKMGKTDKNKTDMLYNLGEALTLLKRRYPIIFIILSQLNKGVESPERNENGKYGNYILEGDILGGDALLQHADLVVGANKPANKHIEYYGPDRYIIDDPNILVFHFLKTRSGDTRMSFFKAAFDKMEVHEMATPGTQQKRIGTV